MTGTEAAADLLSRPEPFGSPFEVRVYPSLGSTNDEAKRLAQLGRPSAARPELAVLAREQTAGRGRLDRRWASPAGNLYLSLLLRPSQPLGLVAQLGFVAALAVAETVGRRSPDITLKWPNDVLARGRKLAGILLETGAAAGSVGEVEWLVVGIGVNVAHAPLETAISLAELGIQITPDALAGAVLEAFAVWRARWEREGFAPVRQAWLARGHRPGERLRVGYPVGGKTGDRHGAFRDLDADGTLLLDTASGPLRVTAGDVHLAA